MMISSGDIGGDLALHDYFLGVDSEFKPKSSWITNNMMDQPDKPETTVYRIENVEILKELWTKTYNKAGKPDWSHILPYYDSQIRFRDSVQELSGIEAFSAMTERLSKRSKDLKMKVVSAVMNENIVFIEWEMTIQYKKNPSSVIYGASRITLNEDGKIIRQRDYYDLWGDIFDNIPRFGKAYRKFMKKKFG